MATKSEFLNQLVKDNDLDTKEDIFKMPLGGKEVAIITRTGIEKIQYNNDIKVDLPVPVGPTIAVTVPLGTTILMSERTLRSSR